MISWGYAFKRGIIAWLWSILWGIIGIVVAMIISGGSMIALFMDPTAIYTGAWVGAMAGIVVGAIIGGLIVTIGSYSTIIKITLDSIQEQRQPE